MKIFTHTLFLTLALWGAGFFSVAETHASAKSEILTKTTQGLKDAKSVPTLAAYPNPSRGETTITLSQAAGEKYKIRISNAIGRVVKTIDVAETTGDTQIEVNLSELPSGFYFYSLLANDKMIETKRLVLQR